MAQDGYTNAAHANFAAGLNLADAPNTVGPGEAIDALNVEFSTRGAVKQRDGYAQFSAALTNQPDSLSAYYTSAGTKRLVVGNGNRLDVLDTSGASVANSTAPTASPHYFVRFGGPTAEVVYVANGTDQVRKLSGTTFSAPAGLSGQTGRFLAVTPTSNRLVVARESGTTAGNNPSSVNFSAAGDPETFSATDYIDLNPGDGEAIMGVVAWREMVFIFKETSFWVHYGEGLTTVGGPEFEVRKVAANVGLVASRALCAGPEGVYFLSRQGVYRTTGGEPELISAPIDPFFEGNPSIYFKSNTLNHGSIGSAAMCWHDHRLFLSVPTGTSTTNDRMLVHDPRYGWWSLYDIAAAALCEFRPSNVNELVFAAPTGSKYVYRHSSSYTADAMSAMGTGGMAITSRWRSGWIDYGSPDRKRIREVELWGSGAMTFTLTNDDKDLGVSKTVTFSSGVDTWGDGTGTDTWGDGTGTDLWGPSGTIRPKLIRGIASRGQTFSLGFANSTLNQTFTVYRAESRIDGLRIPSVVESEAA